MPRAAAQKSESAGAVVKTSVNKYRKKEYSKRESWNQESEFLLSLISENRFILTCSLYRISFL